MGAATVIPERLLVAFNTIAARHNPFLHLVSASTTHYTPLFNGERFN
jgi:hypothetical protein